jgi:hypothetical protein
MAKTTRRPNKIILALKEVSKARGDSSDDAGARGSTLQWQIANKPRTLPERSEAEYAMEAAIAEIEMLRRRVEVLQGKVDMIDLFELVFKSAPRNEGGGMSEDIAWKLRRALDNIKAEKAPGNGAA